MTATVRPGEGRDEAQATGVRLESEKRILPALLLCWFFFWLGAHRFYVGKKWTGVIFILTIGGGFGLWAIVDTIKLLIGSFTDKHGNKLKSWT